eukprot:CAMPEP_0119495242 /NCGR_PEP_ID=MMETSP1344-20130328/18931_1 /TAXON_ID=236787 /ORGANISM="Florenciella parvula, Strain CCMP2471" /LENGTH=445 /DNA_ID=CAMNT_0007530815 /DNA_START=247 /DNA_END=1581 /DNA_ORIENTATION=-
MSDSDSYGSDDESSGSGNGTSNDHTKEYDELEQSNVKITKSNILDQVTRNTIVRAIWHARMRNQANFGTQSNSIYQKMTLTELVAERVYMRRMNFMEVVRVIDARIEQLRKAAREEREKIEKQLIDTRLKALERSQSNRVKQLEVRQERERQDLHQKFAQDETNLLKKHKRNYQKLVEETANRATGGIIQGDDTKQYLTKQNKSASYKTRKPHFDVVKYRKNAQRLREMGRREEALQFESKAAALDEKEEISWREKVAASITSSAWGAAKSKLEQLVESQSTELTRHKREQESKLAWLEQKQVKTKTNFINTLMAERTKVIANCKAQAKKRIENDAVEAMNEQRNRKKVSSQSEGLKNISANIMTNLSKREGDEVPSSLTNSLGAVDETANTAEDNWVAPAFSGVDNSDAIVDNVGDGRDRGFVDFGSRMANELKGGISNTTTDP